MNVMEKLSAERIRCRPENDFACFFACFQNFISPFQFIYGIRNTFGVCVMKLKFQSVHRLHDNFKIIFALSHFLCPVITNLFNSSVIHVKDLFRLIFYDVNSVMEIGLFIFISVVLNVDTCVTDIMRLILWSKRPEHRIYRNKEIFCNFIYHLFIINTALIIL